MKQCNYNFNCEQFALPVKQFKKHLRSLEGLGHDDRQELYLPIILSKLPKDFFLQWKLSCRAKTRWTVSKIVEKLNKYIIARKKIETRYSQWENYGSLYGAPEFCRRTFDDLMCCLTRQNLHHLFIPMPHTGFRSKYTGT